MLYKALYNVELSLELAHFPLDNIKRITSKVRVLRNMARVQIVDLDLSTSLTWAGTRFIPSVIIVLFPIVELIIIHFLVTIKGIFKLIVRLRINNISSVLSPVVELKIAILIQLLQRGAILCDDR